MSVKCSRKSNVELAEIPNSIRDNESEETVTNVCKEHRTDITPMDIEACHRLPFSNVQAAHNPNQCKRVIVKFLNRKHPERLLQIKKTISSKKYSHLNITSKVSVNTSLCPIYRFLWEMPVQISGKQEQKKFSVLEM